MRSGKKVQSDSVDAVILAAGLSERMGVNKMMLKIGGSTVIEHCIAPFLGVCRMVYVVGGHRIHELQELLADRACVRVVENAAYKTGMFSSVLCGVSYSTAGRCFITPGDYPLIQASTCREMLQTEGAVVIPTYNNKKGHPVLLSSNTVQKLRNGVPYIRLKDFLKMQECRTVEVDDPGIRLDVDSPQDYANVLQIIQAISQSAGQWRVSDTAQEK